MSEAAKPADPERALARLEQLERHAADALHDGMLRDVTAGDLAMLLPLARAGLSMQSAVADASKGSLAVLAEALGEREALEWEPHLRREQRRAAEAEAERDALRAEFAACVRALASIRETARRDYTLALMPDVVADSQRALSGPLAAAVLRSPEPAAKLHEAGCGCPECDPDGNACQSCGAPFGQPCSPRVPHPKSPADGGA